MLADCGLYPRRHHWTCSKNFAKRRLLIEIHTDAATVVVGQSSSSAIVIDEIITMNIAWLIGRETKSTTDNQFRGGGQVQTQTELRPPLDI
jgi:hypothetical protein